MRWSVYATVMARTSCRDCEGPSMEPSSASAMYRSLSAVRAHRRSAATCGAARAACSAARTRHLLGCSHARTDPRRWHGRSARRAGPPASAPKPLPSLEPRPPSPGAWVPLPQALLRPPLPPYTHTFPMPPPSPCPGPRPRSPRPPARTPPAGPTPAGTAPPATRWREWATPAPPSPAAARCRRAPREPCTGPRCARARTARRRGAPRRAGAACWPARAPCGRPARRAPRSRRTCRSACGAAGGREVRGVRRQVAARRAAPPRQTHASAAGGGTPRTHAGRPRGNGRVTEHRKPPPKSESGSPELEHDALSQPSQLDRTHNPQALPTPNKRHAHPNLSMTLSAQQQ